MFLTESDPSTVAEAGKTIISWVLGAAAVVSISYYLGLLMGRAGRRGLAQERDLALAEKAQFDAESKERARAMARQAKANKQDDWVKGLMRCLPGFAEKLNGQELDAKDIPPQIMTLANSIFEPAQILFYRTVAPAQPGEKPQLILLGQKGLTDLPDAIKRIPFGEGKIGWVAENRREMRQEDWNKLASLESLTVAANHPSLKIDIAGPLVQGRHVLGVLSIGSPKIQPQESHLLFQMVTNLGSVGMVKAMHVTSLQEKANHDGLTGLLNKRYFMQKLAELMLNAERNAERLGLFIFDIDHFKTYNDTNGHPAGDALLKNLSALLKESARSEDYVCRYGGEEFVIAMPQTDGDEAMAVAERVRRAIEVTHFEHQENQPNGNLTISGGVAVYPQDGSNAEELIQNADSSLYEGKRNGRNQVTRFRGVEIGSETEHEIDRYPAYESSQG